MATRGRWPRFEGRWVVCTHRLGDSELWLTQDLVTQRQQFKMSSWAAERQWWFLTRAIGPSPPGTFGCV